MGRSAAIVTVGTELVEGLRVDTNTAEIARALAGRGFDVAEALSVGDDEGILADALARLTSSHALVVVTGGLGPTHDDITREAASRALSRPLERDERLVRLLAQVQARHRESQAAENVLFQADVLQGAEVIDATTGTAPGQIAETSAGILALLPGPPREMRGMLARVMERAGGEVVGRVRELSSTGLGESDVQIVAQRVLAGRSDVRLTVLAKIGEVRVLLFDRGAGDAELDRLADAVADELGTACFSLTGETLPAAIVREATERGATISVAESCTGGMVAAALTDVAGSSAAFLGGVVAYANSAKRELLGVHDETLTRHGAVSAETASAMAERARAAFGSDFAVATTGIAGPDGGTAEKPVGTVWFALSSADGTVAIERHFRGNRETVRMRSTALALDLVRRALTGLELP